MFRYCRPLGLLLVLLLGVVPARADKEDPPKPREPFRHAEARFTIDLPEGWEVMPLALVNEINALSARKPIFQGMTFNGGFWKPTPGKDPLRYPYVLVQLRRLPQEVKTYEDARVWMMEGNPRARVVSGPVTTPLKELAAGEVFLDRSTNRAVAVQVISEQTSALRPIKYGFLSKGVPDPVQTLRVIGVGFLGKEAVALMHYYDWEEGFAERVGPFQAMVDSFRFDQGYNFVPQAPPAAVAATETPQGRTTEEQRQGNLLLGSVLAVGLGVLATLFMLRSRGTVA